MKTFYFTLVFLLFSEIIMEKELEKTTLGGGCFWCTEAVYKELNGVVDVITNWAKELYGTKFFTRQNKH